jgi:uncharacterized protein
VFIYCEHSTELENQECKNLRMSEKAANASGVEVLPADTPEELAGPPEAPIRREQRFPTLDVLRGFALLGILMLNIEDFAGHEALWNFPVGLLKPAFVGWHAHLDYAIVTLKWLFAEGKMRGMFSMLFGAGAVLLTERLEARGGEGLAAKIFYRRNGWLLLFGAIHGFLIWWGDILLYYSLVGLVCLYPLRRLSARTLIIVGLIIWIAGGTFGTTRAFEVHKVLTHDTELGSAQSAGAAATPEQRAFLVADEKQQRKDAVTAADTIRKERLGYSSGLRYNIRNEISFLKLVFRSLWILEIIGAMLTGMGLYKAGYLTNRRPRKEYVLVALGGYAISSPLVLTGLWHLYRGGFSPLADAKWISIPYSTEVVTAALANASVILLLVRSERLRWALGPVSAVGRTAFSNYILTSLTCKILFNWGPWKLYGQLEFYQWYIVVLAIWTANLVLSSLWLRVFAFGPLEWLWRSLTYWKRQPLFLREIPA